MKHLCLTIIPGLLIAAPAMGLTYLGTPTTPMRAGQWAFGASYAYGEQDLELERHFRFEDLEEESILGRVAVGLFDQRMEIFGLAGIANLEQDRNDLESSDQFLIGLGTRITAYRGDTLDWGLVAQFSWFTNEDTISVDGMRTPYELDVIDVQIGFGPCWRPGPFILYGGPMIQWIDGDIEIEGVGKLDVSAESWFGGYVGAGIELAEHVGVTAELQATPDAWAWGAALMVRF
jgi:hypothetical protein